MTTQEEKINYALYTCSVDRKVGFHSRTWDAFWMEQEDTRITSLIRDTWNGNFDKPIEDYAGILQETCNRHEITYEEAKEEEILNYITLPRGACTLGWLANAGLETHIITLIKAGARPHKEYTLWRYGASSGVWEFLDSIYQGVQGRKMAKPAVSVHN